MIFVSLHSTATTPAPGWPAARLRVARIAAAVIGSAVVLIGGGRPLAAGSAGGSGDDPVAGVGVLTLERVQALCRDRHPALRVGAWDRVAGAAAVRQAEARPNPDLVLESEDFGGTGGFGGFDGSQQTVAIEQRLELGGKRRHRVAAARGELDAAHLEWELLERRVLAAATSAFHEVQRAEQRLASARESLEMAREALAGEQGREEAGRTSEADLQSHRAAEADALIDVEAARSELEAARDRLALHWGEATARFERTAAPASTLPPLPALAPLVATVDATPAVRLADLEVRREEAGLRLERSAAIPDVTVSVGARRFGEGDDQALVAGVSLPLPIFDRNRGRIDLAGARLSQAGARREASRLQTIADIRAAHRIASAARTEADATRTQLLPAAAAGYENVRTGFELGRFSLFDLLAARRALVQARLRLVDAETRFRKGLAELEALAAPSRAAATPADPPAGP